MAGQICAVFANVHRTKDAKTFEAADFIPRLEEVEEEAAPVEPPVVIDVEANSRALMAMLGRTEDDK